MSESAKDREHPISKVMGDLCEQVEYLKKDNAHFRDLSISLQSIIESLRSGTIDSCAACGMPFTHETNAIDHIQQCSKHPMGILQKELAALRARLAFFEREWTFRDTDYDDVDTVFKDELPITCDQADFHRHHVANAWNRLVAKSKEQA